jgi:hypothetical protein
MTRANRLLSIGVCFLLLSGCELINQQVVAGLRKFFPGATIVPQRGGIEIETGVPTGVGRDLCVELFRAFSVRPEFQELQKGMRRAGYRFFALNFGEWCIIWQPAEPGFRVVTRQISNSTMWMQQPLESFSSSSLPLSGFSDSSRVGYPSQQSVSPSQASILVPRGDLQIVWSTSQGTATGSVWVSSNQPVSMQLVRNAAAVMARQGIPPSDFLQVVDNKYSHVFMGPIPAGAGVAIFNNSRRDAQVKVDQIGR